MSAQDLDFTDRVVAITGAAAGIGRAIAEAFAGRGARLVLLDRDAAALERLQAALRGRTETIAAVVDVAEASPVAQALQQVEARFGAIHVLVNNVGGSLGNRKAFAQSTEDEWDALYRINLKHLFVVTHAALPLLKRGGPGGSVINLSTIEAFRAHPLAAVYAAFKSGVTGFTRSLALELAPLGIRVNAIAPETTETSTIRADSWLPAAERERIAQWIPLGRFGAPEDAAGAALYLASPLSAWVTGTTIHLDGGALAAAGWVRTPQGGWTHRPTITGTHWPPAAKAVANPDDRG